MNIGVIFAGGSGTRMGVKNIPKQFLEMHKKPIIIYTLEHFQNHSGIDAVVIACKEDWIDYMQELVDRFHITKVKKIVKGGSTGQESIYNGLCAAKEISGDEDSIVLIHDGVRPMINADVITNNIKSVMKWGTAITTAVVTETILVVDDNEEIVEVPNRAQSRIAKAPQSFWLKDIIGMHERARSEHIDTFIDSCTMMKHYGYSLHLVDGPKENIKITTPDDFYTMRALLDAIEDRQFD